MSIHFRWLYFYMFQFQQKTNFTWHICTDFLEWRCSFVQFSFEMLTYNNNKVNVDFALLTVIHNHIHQLCIPLPEVGASFVGGSGQCRPIFLFRLIRVPLFSWILSNTESIYVCNFAWITSKVMICGNGSSYRKNIYAILNEFLIN